MAPQFSSKSYWQDRFTTSPGTFDWLLPASTLDPLLRTILSSNPHPTPQILHIGCGSSWLSFHLRAHVESPPQVLNVDFAEAAVELGRRKEADLYRDEEAREDVLSSCEAWGRDGEEKRGMRWTVADLLDFASLAAAAGSSGPQFSLVIDKSTSDAIACAESIPANDVFLGMDAVRLGLNAVASVQSLREKFVLGAKNLMDPVIVLSLHLAAVTLELGAWISISHSQERFWFLESKCDEGSTRSLNDLDPKRFWKLEKKEPLNAPDEDEANGASVHRSKIQHWIYVLSRTSEPLP